jgi:hemolysin-activating ACP:hemolysin acyltransferase
MFGRKAEPREKLVAPTSSVTPTSNSGAAPKTNGSAASNKANALSPEEAQRQAIAVARMSVAFAQVVSVLMRSPLHKHFSLADLEWLVLPPLLTGQWFVAEAKAHPNGPGVPVATALWASVSSDVDKRLSDNLNAPIRLRPDEWKSGEILWLVEVVGDGRVVLPLLKQLDESAFKDKEVKLRARSQDGKLVLRTLRAELAAAPKPSQ